jgi:hypothetical protein
MQRLRSTPVATQMRMEVMSASDDIYKLSEETGTERLPICARRASHSKVNSGKEGVEVEGTVRRHVLDSFRAARHASRVMPSETGYCMC